MYIDKLDEIVDNCNKTCRIIKMKPDDVQPSTYIEYGVEHNDKDPKFKVSDNVRRSKYRNIFAKGHTLNWSEEVFVIKEI